MTKKIFIVPVLAAAMMLASCGSSSSTSDQTITFVSAIGSPVVALCGQINSSNYSIVKNDSLASVSLNRGDENIVIADASSIEKDVVCGDSATYAITKVVTFNNDVIVRLNDSAAAFPTDGSTVVSYGKGSAADQALSHILTNGVTMKYVDSRNDLLNYFTEADGADYIVCDRAIYETAYAADSSVADGLYSADLNDLWESYATGVLGTEAGDKCLMIPGDLIYVQRSIADSKSSGIAGFYTNIGLGITNAVSHVDRVQAVMNAYSQDAEQQESIFGVSADVLGKMSEANELAFAYDDEAIGDIEVYLETFYKALGGEDDLDWSKAFLPTSSSDAE